MIIIGLMSTFYRIFSTSAPLFAQILFEKSYYLPFLVLGVTLIISGILSFFLPIETHGRDLQDEITSDLTKSQKEIEKKSNSENNFIDKLLNY
jgi:hypothetical protein